MPGGTLVIFSLSLFIIVIKLVIGISDARNETAPSSEMDVKASRHLNEGLCERHFLWSETADTGVTCLVEAKGGEAYNFS